MFDILMLIAGGTLLFYGGDWLIDGARDLALRMRVSTMLVSIVIVGFGTSAPELFVSIQAVLADKSSIAIGNVVGSNIANLALILGLTAVLLPFVCDRKSILIDGGAMVAATCLLALVIALGFVNRIMAVGILAVLVVFLIWRQKHDDADDDDGIEIENGLRKACLITGAGIVVLPFASWLFVKGASGLAVLMGVSEAIIGLTVVAIGTSLPELAVCVSAALKRAPEVAFGNVLGSNLFNSTVVIAGAGLAAPFAISREFIIMDVPLMLLATVVALVFAWSHFRFSRTEGALLLGGYCGYIAVCIS
ncbi:calcium/sodium antiporter [Pseudaestuariivita rosea]|uniref:calcium/sodium antiporter n=1 Tax=Pseudaestuariivita rosea TaxID=2763263 RepID=UPI001ABAA603|nr:calcium/sodium antiporter [Pseudaestuariivita rosea]